MDKNGKLVTKHVKDNDLLGSSVPAMPAPALAMQQKMTKADLHDLHSDELADGIEHNLKNAGFRYTADQRKYLVDPEASPYALRRLLEAMYIATDGIDLIGAEALFSGATFFNTRKVYEIRHTLEAAALAYPFARKVDDASYPTDNDDDRSRYEFYLGQFAKDFFGDSLSDSSPEPEDVDDLAAAYFLERIGIDKSTHGSQGSYYRSLAKISGSKEDIEPYLPILISSHLVEPESYYTSVNDLTWYVESLKNIVPHDKVEAVAREYLARKVVDFDLAEEIVKNESNAVLDGVL